MKVFVVESFRSGETLRLGLFDNIEPAMKAIDEHFYPTWTNMSGYTLKQATVDEAGDYDRIFYSVPKEQLDLTLDQALKHEVCITYIVSSYIVNEPIRETVFN